MRSTRLPSWIERLAGLDPLPVPPHVFAVSGTGLLYCRLVREEGTLRLGQVEAAPLPADAFAEGPLGGPLRAGQAFGEAVAELLERAGGEISEATLVLPDRWLRAVLAEGEDLPRSRAARQAALLWRLKRLVPFRVDELRVRSSEIEPVTAGGSRRVLLGFAIELLLDQIEDAFSERGVRLGRITGTSLALVSGLARAELQTPSSATASSATASCATLLSVIGETGYSLLVVSRGSPLLYRYKALEPTLDRRVLGPLVQRELALTLSFLSDSQPGLEVKRAVLLAPDPVAPDWLLWLEQALETPSETVGPSQLGLQAPGVGESSRPWHEVAPLVAAGLEEVA